MNEIILSKIQSGAATRHWRLSTNFSSGAYSFTDFLEKKYNIIEAEWIYNTDRLRIKTKTPEQLTWFLLNL